MLFRSIRWRSTTACETLRMARTRPQTRKIKTARFNFISLASLSVDYLYFIQLNAYGHLCQAKSAPGRARRAVGRSPNQSNTAWRPRKACFIRRTLRRLRTDRTGATETRGRGGNSRRPNPHGQAANKALPLSSNAISWKVFHDRDLRGLS